LRLSPAIRSLIALGAAVLPFAVLAWTQSLTLPWIILAFVFTPYGTGVFLLLTRSFFSLPLVVYRGPFEHFTMGRTNDSPQSKDIKSK
jgi:hypothetical protein